MARIAEAPTLLRYDLAALLALPAAAPAFLVLPVLRIADAGLGLDVVEPRVFHALARGPHVLAGDRAGVTADAFVEVQHHRDLSADLHDAVSSTARSTRIGVVEPIDLVQLAHDDELVAVGADRAVIVEAVGELGVAADHVRRLEHRARDGIVDAAALAGDLRARHVHDLLLRVVHHAHAFVHALADDGACGDRAVQVEELDPVVVDDAGLLRIGLRDPHDRTAARQRQHQQIVGVGRMDAPFLVRRDEVEDDFRLRRCCACRACSATVRVSIGGR